MTSTMTTTKKTTSEKPIETLPPNPFIFEILDLASKQRSNAKKVEVLKTYEHDSLKTILIWNFDESVISLLPEGEVPYGDVKDQNVYSGNLSDNLIREANGGESATMQDLEGKGRTSLRREYQNLYHFVKGGNHNLSTTRREMMFINMLQGLHSKESEILCLVKDKKLQTKYKISLENVKEAYPDIVWGGRS
ncbi:MAG: hypothetical protein EB120_04720 [Proteobacteria bacterium]|nr:hypothetical protein [Pseudomonadota bacterium]